MPEKKNELFYLCKYGFHSFVMMKDDEKIEIDPSNILNFRWINDYDNRSRSFILVSLRLDVRKKLWVIRNRRDIVCHVELALAPFNNSMDDNPIGGTSTIFNEDFSLYFADEEETIDTDLLEERLNDSGESVHDIKMENLQESQDVLEIGLFQRSLLKASMQMYNEVMVENTVQQYIGHMMTKTGHSPVLMSKCENDEVYKELIIPPLQTYKALEYLDGYYGLYEKGSIIFYDVDTLYILNCNGKCTAKREKEWYQTTVMVGNMESGFPGNGMVIREDEEIYYVICPIDNVSIQRSSPINNVNIASNMEEVIIDDTSTENENSDTEFIYDRGTIILPRLKNAHKYISSIFRARMEEQEVTLYMAGENYDMRAFRPNHEFAVVFQDQLKQSKYGTFKYRISTVEMTIKPASTQYMDAAFRFVFRKSPENA